MVLEALGWFALLLSCLAFYPLTWMLRPRTVFVVPGIVLASIGAGVVIAVSRAHGGHEDAVGSMLPLLGGGCAIMSGVFNLIFGARWFLEARREAALRTQPAPPVVLPQARIVRR